jgi:serine/threonine-protein kinase
LQSATIIAGLAAAGGWGNGNKMQIDTSINILCADATTPMKTITLPGGACTPDCDDVPSFPVPTGGAVEGETGYACTMGGDCHLLVVDKATNKLWEMWQAFLPPDPNLFNSTSGAFVWDLTKAYPMNLRGDGCTSADAGGFPIAAMLFTADEVAAGHIDHAIRFILPNARIQGGNVYVHPGTHTTGGGGGASGPTNTPPYGAHLRLKSSFDLTKLPSAGAGVVAKAMQKYGMFLADGGNIALTAANDQFTTAKWADANVNVDSHAMYAIQVTDFEVVDMGPLVTTGDNCIRNP